MARKLPRIIIQEEFEKLLVAAKKLERKTSGSRKRNIKEYRLAMLLGFEAGMRISEIVGLEGRIPKLTPDKVEEAGIRIISGKGKKDRIVPRPKRFTEKERRMLPLKISRRPLQAFITKLGKEVLQKDISFHTLRHGFASHLISKGRPLHEVQMLLGHSRLDTTGIYLHANPIKATEGAREAF